MSTDTSTQTPPSTNTPPTNSATPPATSWTDGFSEDLKGYIGTKGFKTAADVVESYRNFEKLQGVPQDRILKLTDKMRGDDGMLTAEGRAIFERLGAPKEAKEYQIEVPKEGGDNNLAEMLRKVAFEEGMSKSAAERLAKEWNVYQSNARKTMQEQAELNAKNAEANLKKEWGAAYDKNTNIAKEAARTLGMDQKSVDALHATLGQEGAMKLFHKLGSSVGEGRFVPGTSTNNVMEPTVAKHTISELMKDKDFGARLSRGDAEATGKWQRLHEMAYPGEF